MSIYPIDQYQNAIPRVMLLHELKNVQLQECFKLLTHDSIGHLQTLCMSVLQLSDGVESERKNGNTAAHPSVLKKCLAFKYEFSFRGIVSYFLNNLCCHSRMLNITFCKFKRGMCANNNKMHKPYCEILEHLTYKAQILPLTNMKLLTISLMITDTFEVRKICLGNCFN